VNASLLGNFRALRDHFRAVWLVRSRILRSDLGFWLIILGYDPKSGKITNKIYLVYALIFLLLWIFMVLTLLADVAAKVLAALPFGSAPSAAVGAAALGLLALFLIEFFMAAKRSPFSFSEEDAALLCQTPVDRRPVALVWFIDAWVRLGLGVWACAVVTAYALLQAQSPRPLTPTDLPAYLLAGGRMFIIAVPLYLAIKALAWAAGAWRLRGRRQRPYLRWVSPALGLLLVGVLVAAGPRSLMSWLAPLVYPLQAGLGLAPWAGGLLLAASGGILSLAVLWAAARDMSLARAAQETHNRQAIQAAAFTMQMDLLEELTQRQRLRGERQPSRIPGREGPAAALWKSAVQASRRFSLGSFFSWLAMVSLPLAFLILPDGGARIGSAAMWLMLAGSQMVAPLRRDVTRWWISRQLPFRSEDRVGGLLVLPVARLWLAGLAALVIAALMGGRPPLTAVWLYLIAIPAVGLAASVDVLRQCRTQDLLAGRVPAVGATGLLFSLLAVALTAGFAWLLMGLLGLPAAAAFPFLVFENLLVVYGFWRAAGLRLRQLK